MIWGGTQNIPLEFRIPLENRICESCSLFWPVLKGSHTRSSLQSLEQLSWRKAETNEVLNTKWHAPDSTKLHPSRTVRSWYFVTYKEGREIHKTSVYHFCRPNSSDWNSEKHEHQAGHNWSDAQGCQRPPPACESEVVSNAITKTTSNGQCNADAASKPL